MTNQEAIKYIENHGYISDDVKDMAIKALEKQIAKEVKFEPWMNTECDCGFVFSVHHGDGYHSIPYENQTKYCPNCGQKLDWGEEE